MIYQWPKVWCCINPREQGALNLCLLQFTVGQSYIERATFDVYFAAFSFGSGTEVPDTFIILYMLTPGTVTLPSGDPVDVLYFDTELMAEFYTFSLTPQYTCSGKCKILVYDVP